MYYYTAGAMISGVEALAVIAHIPVTDRHNIKIALTIFLICLFIFYILSKIILNAEIL